MSDASPLSRRLSGRLASRLERPRTGEHAGAPRFGLAVDRAGRSSFHPLTAGSHLIGGGPDCDVVVLGAEPAPLFRLTLAGDGGRSTLQVLGEALSLAGRRLSPGEILLLAGPTAVTAGDLAFRVDVPVAARSGPLPPIRRLVAGGLLALAAVLLVAGLQLDGGSQASPVAAAEMSPPGPSVSPPEAIVAELGAAARQAGLSVAVALADGGRTIRIGPGAAPLTAEGRSRLQRLVAAIGRRSPVPIVDETRVASGLDGFVAAAGYEPFRFIVGADGKRYRVGDALPGDWRIAEIRDGALVVSRGGENDLVPFGIARLAMRPGLETVAAAEEP